MFEKTIVLDAGSYQFRAYDPARKEVRHLRNVWAVDGESRRIRISDEAFKAYWNARQGNPLVYPMEKGKITKDIQPVFDSMIDALHLDSYLMKPNALVILHSMDDENQREIWKQKCLEAGFRKVRFQSPLERLNVKDQVLIHTGYSGSELVIYAGNRRLAHQQIIFGGKEMDRAIQEYIGKTYKALIFEEDAAALKEAASKAFYENRNPRFSCIALDQTGQYVQLEFPALDLWPSMEKVEKQIVMWMKDLLSQIGVDQMERVLKKPLLLCGGLAQCFGLKEMLEQEIGCKVSTARDSEDVLVCPEIQWETSK